MFAGIGGFRTGLTNAGDFLCRSAGAKKTNTRRKPIGYSTERKENTFADDKCRDAAFRTINPADLPDFDLICGGFPSGLPDMSALFLSQGNDLDLLTKEARSFMKSALCESKAIGMKPGTLSIFCLRTCRGYSLTKGGKLSSLSSPRLSNWGILLNGVLLTAQTSVSPRTGSECTLSDILIADCPAKYILSEKAHIQILSSLFPDAKVSVYIPPMEPPYV